MSDDWSPPTGEHDRPAIRPAMEPRTAERLDCVDPVLGISERDLRVVDAFYHNLGVAASEDPSPPTAAEQESIDRLGEQSERLYAMTPEELLALRDARARR